MGFTRSKIYSLAALLMLLMAPAVTRADDSCVRDSNYATIECMRGQIPALQTKMNLYIEKLRSIYDDPSCQSINECSAKKEALSRLNDSQERWLADASAELKSACDGGSGWEPMLCKLDFKIKKTESRLNELKALLKAAEEGNFLPTDPQPTP
jgi:uncharacterized protein YecT (DUF1311 family)